MFTKIGIFVRIYPQFVKSTFIHLTVTYRIKGIITIQKSPSSSILSLILLNSHGPQVSISELCFNKQKDFEHFK